MRSYVQLRAVKEGGKTLVGPRLQPRHEANVKPAMSALKVPGKNLLG
jgi:hypothetical protein